ncbi:MAG TPA: hypothetical protein VNV86_10895, partial [Candidatus Acidoferrum sp.]|nr:hypothetical protein [Candidatus Acidoferrum sp.]
IWHPSALPIDKQNKEGYHALQQQLEEYNLTSEYEERDPSEAEAAIHSFSDSVTALIDALPEEELCSRPWSIVLRCHPLFRLISLWPSVGVELAPAIAESAKRHGLICYDPQNEVVTVPH